jgi:hypothetical protein
VDKSPANSIAGYLKGDGQPRFVERRYESSDR